MQSLNLDPFSESAFENIHLDLRPRSEGLAHIASLMKIPPGEASYKPIIGCAIKLFEMIADVEQQGHDIAAIPVKVADGDDGPSRDEIRKIRFDFCAGKPEFARKYHSSTLEGGSLTLRIPPEYRPEIRLLAGRTGIRSPDLLISKALDRVAVFLEFESGAGVFTAEPHYVGDYDEKLAQFDLIKLRIGQP